MRSMYHCLAIKVCCITLFCASTPGAAEPPADPILRIETAAHTAPISSITTDAKNRWLATASLDKTLRVWDIQNGALLQTLRPPLGEGGEGMLYSVAMSPDGTLIATGGWTGVDWDTVTSIYIFERATGRLLRRITGGPGVISSLVWSPDGGYLAAGLSAGIRVYRTGDFTLAGQDTDYGGEVYGLDFNSTGRLVTSSYDGLLRLYHVESDKLQLIAKKSAPGGQRPRDVRFSPDGTMIALGFNDLPNVNLLAADTLNILHAPNVEGIKTGNLSQVSWSADGRTLYASGTVKSADGKFLIRAWSQGGRGAFRDVVVPVNNTIMHIRTLASGGVVFGSADPTWGVFGVPGERPRLVKAATADFREGFHVSRDGLTVRFSFGMLNRLPARFNLTERRYEESSDEGGLLPPLLTAQGIEVKNWQNAFTPTINGQALKLKQYETSLRVAVAPDGQSLVLGTNFYLRRFDRAGHELWQQIAPPAVSALNISADGQLVVAGYHDGTIRWHRLSDGKELAAFFPHADRRRWVVWTPSGYYDASPGAEDLIGWHLNRGKDNAADFFPASRFRAQLNRPDVITKIFDTLDEGEALRLANVDAGRRVDAQFVKVQNVLPPIVEILSPTDGTDMNTTRVTIKYSTRSPADAPVTGLRARVNGQMVILAGTNNVAATDGLREINVPIPPQDSLIQLFAENKNGFSAPAAVRVNWTKETAAAPTAKEEAQFKPKLYVLAVGVSKYADPDLNLALAAKDARDFAAVLQQQQGKLYSEVKVRLLTDEKATKDDVLDGLEWLKREVTARDVGMLLLAGHGKNDNTNNYYFLPHNADLKRLLRTGVPQNDIKIALNSLAGKAIFFVDTCHSGNVLGTAKTRGVNTDINAFVNELASAENGVVVFTASTGRQVSLEKTDWGNGAFTKAVVEGLSGKADFKKTGRITHKGLDFYVTERVKELTEGQQSPVSISPAGVTDFPIAAVGQ